MASEGPNSADSAVNADNGATDWINPSNALTSNNTYATVSTLGTASDWLRVTDFDFVLSGATAIVGITVEIEWVSTGSPSYEVFLRWGGAQRGTAKTGTIPSSEQYTTLGGIGDLWGATPNVSNITGSDFGVDIRDSTVGSTTVQVDHVRITVEYSTTFDPTVNPQMYDSAVVAVRRWVSVVSY